MGFGSAPLQQVSNSTGAALAYASANTAESLLICIVSAESEPDGWSTNPPIAPTDTNGNTWLFAVQDVVFGKLAMFYVLSCKAGANTVSPYATDNPTSISLYEWSGGATSLDVVTGNGDGTTGLGGNFFIFPTAGSELVMAAADSANVFSNYDGNLVPSWTLTGTEDWVSGETPTFAVPSQYNWQFLIQDAYQVTGSTQTTASVTQWTLTEPEGPFMRNSSLVMASFVAAPTPPPPPPPPAGHLYASGSGSGLTFSALELKDDGSPNNLTVTGLLDDTDSGSISEKDVRARLYDNATFELRVINWSDPSQGDLKLLSGTVGDVKMENGMFTMELRGLTQFLTTVVGSVYGPTCRAELFGGGASAIPIDPNNHWKCRLNRDDWYQTGSVGSSPDSLTIVPVTSGSPPTAFTMRGSATTPTAAAPAGWFADGLIKFTSGVLNGYSFEIATWDTNQLVLFAGAPMPFAPSPGDTFEIEPGCDKTKPTCFAKFNNVVNFAAEAEIPGLNVLAPSSSQPQVSTN